MGRSYEQLSLDDRCEIARLSASGSSVRQIATALDRSPSTISRELSAIGAGRSAKNPAMPSNRHERGAGRAVAWTGSPACAAVLEGLSRAGRPNRSPAGSPASTATRLSPTRASTASSMPRSGAPPTSAGDATCPTARASAAIAAGRAAVPQASSKAVFPWQTARSRPPIATWPGIGKPT